MNNPHTPPSNCPKCRAVLPDGLYEGRESACPACGLVFEKFRAAQHPGYRLKLRHPHPPVSDGDDSWLALLLAVPEPVSRSRFYAGIIGWVFFLLWGATIAMLDYRTGAINQSFLHGPLLVFHEAGHVIFHPFGEFITVLGGTLAQLLMPIVLLIALLRHNHDTLGASLALWLLGISLLDVAPYIYDAFAPQIVLLNGATGEEGGHDWIYLLNELGALQRAHSFGRTVYWLGIITLIVAAAWAATLLRRQRHLLTLARNPRHM